MKKHLLILSFFVLSISICTASFSDLSSNHWAYESVMYLTELGIISGMPDGTFKGNEPMTRYQTAVAMKRLIDLTNTQTGGQPPISSNLQSRLSELEALVNRSLNAVQKAGEDYRTIMAKLEAVPFSTDNSGLEYGDLEGLVDEILEVKLDSRNIDGKINQVDKEVGFLKQENQEILSRLDMNNKERRETTNRLKEMDSKINTYRWVSISSAVIAIGSLIMASYVLLK